MTGFPWLASERAEGTRPLQHTRIRAKPQWPVGAIRMVGNADGIQPAGSALDAHPREGRDSVEGNLRTLVRLAVVFGVPLGAWPAHVVELGSIGVEQALGQVLQHLAEVGDQARRLVA